jgi:hypothetical protein
MGGQLRFSSGEIDRRNQNFQARTSNEATTHHIHGKWWPITTRWSLRNAPDTGAYATCHHVSRALGESSYMTKKHLQQTRLQNGVAEDKYLP